MTAMWKLLLLAYDCHGAAIGRWTGLDRDFPPSVTYPDPTFHLENYQSLSSISAPLYAKVSFLVHVSHCLSRSPPVVTMSFTFRDHLGGRGSESHPRQYPILQPQIQRPARSQAVPPRDRYRAPRLNVPYDGVEDDGTCRPEQPLDSFGEDPLQEGAPLGDPLTQFRRKHDAATAARSPKQRA